VTDDGPGGGLGGEDERTAALAHALARAIPDPRGLWVRLTFARVTTSRAVVTPRTILDCGTRTRLEVTGTLRRSDGERPFSFQSARPFAEAVSALEHALREALRPVPRVAPPAGRVDVVLSPQAAAVFFHEAVGHPLEREGEGRASVLARVRGAVVAAPGLHVTDDPTHDRLPGSYLVDDEGVPARPVTLLDDGRVAELLSDRRTAGAESNGHGRASDFRRPPRPRLSNLIVSPGRTPSRDLLLICGDGILVREISAGSADPESGRFFLAVERAELLRRGKAGASLLPFMIGGDVLAALAELEGDRGDLAEPASGLSHCVKGGDAVPVGGSSPAVIVRGLTVRGPR
jgi:TldD protein